MTQCIGFSFSNNYVSEKDNQVDSGGVDDAVDDVDVCLSRTMVRRVLMPFSMVRGSSTKPYKWKREVDRSNYRRGKDSAIRPFGHRLWGQAQKGCATAEGLICTDKKMCPRKNVTDEASVGDVIVDFSNLPQLHYNKPQIFG